MVVGLRNECVVVTSSCRLLLVTVGPVVSCSGFPSCSHPDVASATQTATIHVLGGLTGPLSRHVAFRRDSGHGKLSLAFVFLVLPRVLDPVVVRVAQSVRE